MKKELEKAMNYLIDEFLNSLVYSVYMKNKFGDILTKLRDKLIKGVLSAQGGPASGGKNIPNSHLNGHPTKRLPNNANFRFKYVEGEAIIMMLDSLGIAASTASACSSPKLQPSHVLLACNIPVEEAHGSLRLTLGRWTTECEIDEVLKILPDVVEKLRKMSPFK